MNITFHSVVLMFPLTGWVNTLLGHPAWAPLGRLTFTAYLIHPIVLFIFLSHQGTALYLSLTLMVSLCH